MSFLSDFAQAHMLLGKMAEFCLPEEVLHGATVKPKLHFLKQCKDVAISVLPVLMRAVKEKDLLP